MSIVFRILGQSAADSNPYVEDEKTADEKVYKTGVSSLHIN
jgi:hypothetical protein